MQSEGGKIESANSKSQNVCGVHASLICEYYFCHLFSQSFFAFDYREEFKVNGWEVYDADKEYKRLVSVSESLFPSILPSDCQAFRKILF